VRQYKSRFPKLKNVKAEEWIWIGQEMQHRAALGKGSEPYLHDNPLPPDRVVREIARHKNKTPAATLSNREYANTEFLLSPLIRQRAAKSITRKNIRPDPTTSGFDYIWTEFSSPMQPSTSSCTSNIPRSFLNSAAPPGDGVRGGTSR
jgi:hypothetical protein